MCSRSVKILTKHVDNVLRFQMIHAQTIRVRTGEAAMLPTPGDSRVPVLKTSEVHDATVGSTLYTITKWCCNMCFCNNINVYVLLRVSTYLSHHLTTRSHGCGNKVTIVDMTISQGLPIRSSLCRFPHCSTDVSLGGRLRDVRIDWTGLRQ